jgi:F-type H+-transporting ATPase subunit epsilon
MKLKVLLAAEVLLEAEVSKVNAEAQNGHFCLLPNHVDFVTALVPGILSFEISGGEEAYLAVDAGILVKCGKDVLVSARNGVRGPDLGQLRRTVSERFEAQSEHEKSTRTAMAKIEAGFVRRFLEIQRYGS